MTSCTVDHNPSWEQVWRSILVLYALIGRESAPTIFVYGIPRGGRVIASFLPYLSRRIKLDTEYRADSIVIDDVIETGRTAALYPGVQHFALYGKIRTMPSRHTPNVVHTCICNTYIRFPWESSEECYGHPSLDR